MELHKIGRVKMQGIIDKQAFNPRQIVMTLKPIYQMYSKQFFTILILGLTLCHIEGPCFGKQRDLHPDMYWNALKNDIFYMNIVLKTAVR